VVIKEGTGNRRQVNPALKCHDQARNLDQDFSDRLSSTFSFDLTLKTPNNTQATMAITTSQPPTPEDIEELLLITRYGELDELKSFIEKFGTKPLTDARDEDGNTVLHMVCGNGHLGATDSAQRIWVLFQCSFTD